MKTVKTAIVTLALGDRYVRRFERHFRPGWAAYAAACGADLHVLTEPVDPSPRAAGRSPAWQKCVVHTHPALAGYDRLAWVDADCAVRPDAPSLFDAVAPGRVGAVDEFATPTRAVYDDYMAARYARWAADGVAFVENRTPREYHARVGLDGPYDAVCQTGVLVYEPARHGSIFQGVYDDFEETGGPELNYEMRYLSFRLQQRADVQFLDHRFNTLWPILRGLHYPFLEAPAAPADSAADPAGGRLRRLAGRAVRRARRAAGGGAETAADPADGRLRDCLAAAVRYAFVLHFAGNDADWKALPPPSPAPPGAAGPAAPRRRTAA